MKKSIIKFHQWSLIPIFWLVSKLFVKEYQFQFDIKQLDKKDKYLLVANHTSMLDPFLCLYSANSLRFHSKLSPYSFFIANRFIRKPFLGSWLRLLGCFPAKQTSGMIYGTEAAKQRLNNGYSVMIFPEGRIVSQKSGPVKPKVGVEILAKQKLTIIPIHIKKSHNIFRSFEIKFGVPQKMSNKSAQQIMDRVYSLG